MSKQMRSAYSALRMKDTLSSIAEAFQPILLVLCALALLCCNTGLFVALAIVATVALGVWAAFRGLAAFLNLRMHWLGFDEVELERLALA